MPKKAPHKSDRLMFENEGFSPLLMVGLFGSKLPTYPIDFMLQKITDNLSKSHPAVMNRLGSLNGKIFLIKPRDLPHNIRLEFSGEKIKTYLDNDDGTPADVTICGSLHSLIAMMNGNEDGDALFFNRKISVEGDTEALLTLRNAMDGDDIDFYAELIENFGFFKKPIAKILNIGSKINDGIKKDMDVVNHAALYPFLIRFSQQEHEIGILKQKITGLETDIRKIKNKIQSLDRKSR